MAFRSWDAGHLARFNSATSSDFLDFYENFVDKKLKEDAAKPSHRTFAASSFRCDRRSWFRLRGVQPDVPKKLDSTLQFTADIGTACHRIIQSNLRDALGSDWISVDDYLKTIDFPYEYTIQKDESGLEYQIEITSPYPIRFSCDGVVRWKGKLYLLEIKTSEFSSWDDLTDPKMQHIDQIKCYASLLRLSGVLFLYQDRQYGGLKCYEETVTETDSRNVFARFEYVMDMVAKNLAPEPLPKGDPWCTPSMCPYYKKCGEYGR